MARSLDQITKDVASLEAATKRIDQDLRELYKDYLAALGKALNRQLVLAAYHLCTQAYPDQFLHLSVSQREKVQAGIRKIAAQGSHQIEQLGMMTDLTRAVSAGESEASAAEEVDTAAQTNMAVDEGDADSEPVSPASETGTSDQLASETDPTSEEPTPNHDDLSNSDNLKEAPEASEMAKRLTVSLSLFAVFAKEPLSPVNLAKRHVLLERHLRAILQTLSSLTNYLLKQAHILPDLPEMVIAAAAESDPGESAPGTPNLLNVLVEIGGDRESPEDEAEEEELEEDSDFSDEDGNREMTHLVAINLRIADIEFADAHTALWRSRLQEILVELKRLGNRYQKLQQEKARAEAEHAWRAIWYDN